MITSTLTKPTELWLEISPEVLSNSWENSQRYSSPFTRWRAYLNQVSVATFMNYLHQEQELPFSMWPSSEDLSKFWELINGSVINIGEKRLVLIPTEIVDEDELRIPQEWVDIPNLVADYYLAVQVIPDDQCLKIWGYITHKQLRAKANYDFKDRSYCLAENNLIKNISVLWLSYDLCANEITQEVVQPIPLLNSTQAQNLLGRLANPEVIEPRLEIPFLLWGGILQQETLRNQLCDQRFTNRTSVAVNLGNWFNNIFESAWQSLDNLFSPSNLAAGYRRNNLNNNAIKRAKYLQISATQAVVLLIELTLVENNRSQIVIKLQPVEGDRYLPRNINFILLSSTEESIYQATANRGVNMIKKEITLTSNESFILQISLNEFNHREEFTV